MREMTLEAAIRYKSQIEGKMGAEQATNLSNLEIERCLKDCVGALWLIPYAKILRDANKLELI